MTTPPKAEDVYELLNRLDRAGGALHIQARDAIARLLERLAALSRPATPPEGLREKIEYLISPYLHPMTAKETRRAVAEEIAALLPLSPAAQAVPMRAIRDAIAGADPHCGDTVCTYLDDNCECYRRALDAANAVPQEGEVHEEWCASLDTTRLTKQPYECNCRPAGYRKAPPHG